MREYVLGYIAGYMDGLKGNRAPDKPARREYTAGYDSGYNDGIHGEPMEYTGRDLPRATD